MGHTGNPFGLFFPKPALHHCLCNFCARSWRCMIQSKLWKRNVVYQLLQQSINCLPYSFFLLTGTLWDEAALSHFWLRDHTGTSPWWVKQLVGAYCKSMQTKAGTQRWRSLCLEEKENQHILLYLARHFLSHWGFWAAAGGCFLHTGIKRRRDILDSVVSL